VPQPEPAGSFTPEYLRDDAFRSLSEWVEYVLDHDRQALGEWVQQFRFDFDPFICKEETTAEKPKPPPGARRQLVPTSEDFKNPAEVRGAKTAAPKPKTAEFISPSENLAEFAVPPPSQLQLELESLQQHFLEMEGGLDAPERLALWPELAWRHAELKNPSDAAICWINRIWEARDGERALLRELAGKWAQMEKIAAEPKRLGEALDRLSFKETPSAAEVRALVAGVVYGALQDPAPQALLDRLPRLQQFLERHENSISVRAVWLGWYHLCKLAGNDDLGLARVRDRLLDRLIQHGLSAEHDLPQFLRAAGHQDSERLRLVRAQADKLHDMALEWYRDCDASSHGSAHYVDLIFSFGFARLGETARSRELLRFAEEAVAHRHSRLAEDARRTLSALAQAKSDEERHNHEQAAKLCDEIQNADEFLLRSFRYRIEQALRGQRHSGPLPQEIRDDIERRLPKDKLNSGRYTVDRMRERSDILEPQEELDPYRTWLTENINPELDRELAKLHDVKRPKDLVQTVQGLWKAAARESSQAVDRLSILAESVMLSPRAGESFALELLAMVEPTLERLPSEAANPKIVDRQALLLERALFIAGNYDRSDLVQRLMRQFVLLLQRVQQAKARTWYVNRAFGQCLRSLRKLGLRDDIGMLIEQATTIILHGKSLEELKARSEIDQRGGKMPSSWPNTVEGLLYLAGGWIYFGWHDRALPILDAARLLLQSHDDASRSGSMGIPDYVNLASAYVEVLGQAPADFALRRIEELFLKMRRFREGFSTTQNFLARFHLAIIEAVVMSIVSEDFAIGPGARRWLDDDEYLVRRRIHRDHKQMKELAEV